MKKFFIICLFFFVNFLCQTLFAQIPQPTSTPGFEDESDVIKVSSNLIQVDVVVTDENNRPVKNLKREDFEIFEGRVKQDIFSFTYISPRPINNLNNSSDDNLNLQNDEDGLSLKDKINVPAATKSNDKNSFRRTLVIVIDNIGLSFNNVGLVKKSIQKFIKEQVKEGDLVTVVTTAGASVLPAFTSDKKQLLAMVDKLKWNPRSRGGTDIYDPIKPTLADEVSDSKGFDIAGLKEQTALLKDIDSSGKNDSSVGTISALQYIVQGMKSMPGRKALILFSEGFSLSETSGDSSKSIAGNQLGSGSTDVLKMLVETANKAEVVIYPIDPRGLQTPGMANADEDIRQAFTRNDATGRINGRRSDRELDFRQSQDSLRQIAAETGGFAIINQNDIDAGLVKVMDDQSYYLLSFQTETESIESKKDFFDKVEIKLKNPNLNVRFRNAFYTPGAREAFDSSLSPRQKVGLALAYPFKANEINLNLYSITGNSYAGDFVRFLINISAKDLKFKKTSDGMRKTNFDMLAITLNENGKPVEQFAQNFNVSVNEATYKNILNKGFVYVLPVVLKKSGTYHFRVAIYDSETGKVGAAAKFLETPKFEKKRLWLSNLTLKSFSGNEPDAADKDNDKKMFTDTTLRQFSAPVILNYGAVIYNAERDANSTPDLEIQTRLLQDNKVIAETPFEAVSTKDQKDLNRIDVIGRITLEKNLMPGNYIFQIIVVDKLAKKKTQIATQWVDFELTGK